MASGRIHALDTLRGLMLVVMAVDHLDLYGPVYRLTFETAWFASAAEGFVLLSGMVAGLVYGGYAVEPGRLGAKVRHRLATLWRYHLVIVAGLGVTWLVHTTHGPHGVMPALARLAGGAVLLNQEPPLDILPLYLLFVALLPLVLAGLRAGRAPMLLAASAALWLLDQGLTGTGRYPAGLSFDFAGVAVAWQSNHFHPLAWQFLFVTGVWAGWRHRHGGGGPAVSGRGVVALAAALVVLGAALRHGIAVPELSRAELIAARVNLGPWRMLNVAAIAVLLTAVAGRWPALLRSRWLELLGRHALLVFTWQTLVQMLAGPLYRDAAGVGLPARLAMLAVVVASLALPALWADRRRR
jgi:hypothetical protein